MWLLILERLSLECIVHLIYFPFWWYTEGMIHAVTYCLNLLAAGNSTLAPGLWLRNMFVPMFGQNDWQGRIMSFFMRLMNVIARGFALCIWSIVCGIVFLLWILVFPIILYMLVQAF